LAIGFESEYLDQTDFLRRVSHSKFFLHSRACWGGSGKRFGVGAEEPSRSGVSAESEFRAGPTRGSNPDVSATKTEDIQSNGRPVALARSAPQGGGPRSQKAISAVPFQLFGAMFRSDFCELCWGATPKFPHRRSVLSAIPNDPAGRSFRFFVVFSRSAEHKLGTRRTKSRTCLTANLQNQWGAEGSKIDIDLVDLRRDCREVCTVPNYRLPNYLPQCRSMRTIP